MAKRRRRNQDEPGLIRGAYDAVTGAPGEFAHGILDEADLLLGTGSKKRKGNPRKAKRAAIGGSASKRKARVSVSTRKRLTTKRKTGASKRRAANSYQPPSQRKRSGKKAKVGYRKTTRGSAAWRLRFFNPSGEHVPGLPAKYQRMYEDIVMAPGAEKRYGARLKEVAARTVRKAAQNPGSGRKKYGRPALRSETSTGLFPRARRIVKRRGYTGLSRARHLSEFKQGTRGRRKQRLSNSAFNEFRGRPAKSTYSIMAADGTPRTTKEAGGLEELIINGRKYVFNPHKAKLLYNGNRLHIGGVRFNGSGDLGEIESVAYKADKPHIGAPRSDSYIHHFGEEGGKRPRCIVDREGLPRIVGGSYRISPEGIIN